MMQKQDILQLFEFYARAPSDLKNEIDAASSRVNLLQAVYCFREGSECANIALIGQGMVRVFKASPDGREVTLYRVGPGELCLLTLQCALSGDRYAASGISRSPVDAVLLPAEAFRNWTARYSDLRMLVFSTMTRRLTDLMVLVEEIAFRHLDQRLAAFLLERLDGSDATDGHVAMTHEAIAVELGTAREVISRLLKELERAGAIDLARGQICPRNLQLLRRLVTDRSWGQALRRGLCQSLPDCDLHHRSPVRPVLASTYCPFDPDHAGRCAPVHSRRRRTGDAE